MERNSSFQLPPHEAQHDNFASLRSEHHNTDEQIFEPAKRSNSRTSDQSTDKDFISGASQGNNADSTGFSAAAQNVVGQTAAESSGAREENRFHTEQGGKLIPARVTDAFINNGPIYEDHIAPRSGDVPVTQTVRSTVSWKSSLASLSLTREF